VPWHTYVIVTDLRQIGSASGAGRARLTGNGRFGRWAIEGGPDFRAAFLFGFLKKRRRVWRALGRAGVMLCQFGPAFF
jgi:hypothetical protein